MDTFNTNKLFVGFSIAIVALILSLGLSYALAQTGTWTAPQCAPPGCNVDAPLNVGSSHQSKLGSVSINTATSNPDPFGLDVFGISRFFGNVQIGTTTNGRYATIQIVDGNQGAGKVLTSDGNGNASWRTVPTISGPSVEYKTCSGSAGGVNYGGVSCTALCSAGKHVIGGGCTGSSGVDADSPNTDNTGWVCNSHTGGGYPAYGLAQGTAICQ
jgi:hypothetical protein